MDEKQLGVAFDVPGEGKAMLRNLARAKRMLRAGAKKRGLRVTGAPPLPPDADRLYLYAQITGKYRVIVQYVVALYPAPDYQGRVDAICR